MLGKLGIPKRIREEKRKEEKGKEQKRKERKKEKKRKVLTNVDRREEELRDREPLIVHHQDLFLKISWLIARLIWTLRPITKREKTETLSM